MIAIPAVLFYGLFFRYMVNVPINDDYSAVLDFLNKCINAEAVQEKLKLIFSQHNEHRIVYDRIWTIISYKLHGHVDFNFLALIGNLSLIPIFWIFFRKVQSVDKNLLLAIPISVLVFNIGFYENMTFAMATLSNLTVFVFSLLSIHYLTTESITQKNLALSLIFLTLAILTQGSGVFLIPVSVAILIYRRQRKMLWIYLGVAGVLAGLYFMDFHKPDNSPSVLETLMYFKVRAVLFAFAFLGNAFNYNLMFGNELNESIGLTSLIGLMLFGLYLYTIKTQYYKKNLFVFSLMTLMVMTAFITGITRCQLGLETAGSSRYRINGVVFLLAVYLWFLDVRKDRNTNKTSTLLTGAAVGLFSVLYLLFSLNQYEYLSFRKRQVLLGVLNYHSGDFSKLYGFEHELYKRVLAESAKNDTYQLPSFAELQPYFPYAARFGFQKSNQNADRLFANAEGITKLNDSRLVEGWAFIEDQEVAGQKVYVGLKSANDASPVFYTTVPLPRFDLNAYFKKDNNLEDAGFSGRIRETDIPAGESEVWVMVQAGGQVKIIQTDKKITK